MLNSAKYLHNLVTSIAAENIQNTLTFRRKIYQTLKLRLCKGSLQYELKSPVKYHLKLMNLLSRLTYAPTQNNLPFKRTLYQTFRLCNLPIQKEFKSPKHTCNKFVIALNVLTWLGFVEEDKDKESELIMTLKRAVLCTQREQYEKAEQMLHIALRLAQQQQNHNGVLYCYDLMANLAMDTQQLDKAEKLFVSVMQMLLSNGMEQDNLKVIHVSLKLARICHLKAENEKAEVGFNWCLDKIKQHKEKNGDSLDASMLHGVIEDWYAQYLVDTGRNDKSFGHLREAHRLCKETAGEKSEQNMLLLNDLGITCFRAGDLDHAQEYLNDAVRLGEKIEEKTHVGVVNANFGLILLEKGMLNEAKKYCSFALQMGKSYIL